MGNEFAVNVWDTPKDRDYYWLQIYGGDSIMKALYNLWWAKRQGWKCIKLEWRPR